MFYLCEVRIRNAAPQRVLGAYFALAQNDPLEGREAFDAHRTACMEFIGADADLRAQAEFETIGEARAGVDHDAGGIDLAQETLGMHMVAGHDRVSVVAAVSVDVRD